MMYTYTPPNMGAPFHTVQSERSNTSPSNIMYPPQLPFHTFDQQLDNQTPPVHNLQQQRCSQIIACSPRSVYQTTDAVATRCRPGAESMPNSTTFNDGAESSQTGVPPYYPRRPRYLEMIEVYIGDQFIKKVPLKLLIRFSKRAAETFPLTTSSTETRRDTCQPTPDIDPMTGRPVAKRLQLNMDDETENPTNWAIIMAIKWMFDNQDTARDATLIPFGPPRLYELDLVSVIDCYQAALVIDMRPFPSRIKHELQRRVTLVPPSVQTFELFTRFIPAEDPTMVRLLTSFKDWYNIGSYRSYAATYIRSLLESRAGLQRKAREVFCARDRKMEHQRLALEYEHRLKLLEARSFPEGESDTASDNDETESASEEGTDGDFVVSPGSAIRRTCSESNPEGTPLTDERYRIWYPQQTIDEGEYLQRSVSASF